MKLKTSIFVIALALLLGFAYSYRKLKIVENIPIIQTVLDNFSSQIIIVFKKGVMEKEALDLLDKYDLKLVRPEYFYKYQYITLNVKNGSLDEYAKKIKELNLPSVRNVTVFNNRNAVQPWITVDFYPVASQDIVDQVLSVSENLVLEEKPDPGNAVYVSKYKEKEVISLIQKEPLVEWVMPNTTLRID